MKKNNLAKRQPGRPILTVLLFLASGIYFTVSSFGQASLIHDVNADFNKGYPNNMAITGDKIVMPYTASSMGGWTATGSIPKALQNHQAVYWNNLVFVTGGLEVTGFKEGVEVRQHSSTVYSATVNNGLSNWTELNALPDGIAEHASVVANGYIYVIGGFHSDSIASNQVYYAKIRADGTIRDWQTNSTPLPSPMWGHTATAINGYIVISGGSNTSDTTATSTVYSAKVEPDGKLLTFNVQPGLTVKRNQHAAAAYGSRLYVMGGFDESGVLTNSVVYTDVDLNGTCSAWQSANNLPETLYGMSASCQNGIIMLTGGYNDNAGYSVQYSAYADVTVGPAFTWQQSGLYFAHIAKAQSIAVDGKLYVVGGFDIFNNTHSECYYNTLNLSASLKTTDGNFMGEVFDLGLNRQVDSISYTGLNLATYNYNYRTASDAGIWSSWTNVTGTPKTFINASIRYIQYMFSVSAAATNNTIALDNSRLRFAATQLSGTINTDQTWTLANSPYWVTDDLFLDGGATITVEAGVNITFGEGTKLQVGNAHLNCNGTSGNEVTFTSFTGEDGFWNGLHFIGTSNSVSSTMNYVIIENAGFGGAANLHCYTTNQPVINNGVIRNGTNRALYCNEGSPQLNTATLTNNKGYLIELETGGGPVFNNEIITGNEKNLVHIIGSTIKTNAFWDNIGSDYVIDGPLYITAISGNPNPRLTIEKGLTLQFATGSGITIGHSYYAYRGELWAEGSADPDSIITFTALNGLPGGWEGITFTNGSGSSGSVSSLKYCLIEKGNDYNLYSETTSQPTIDNCTFTKSHNKGINLYNSSISITNSEIYGNSGDGLYGVLHPYYSNDITVNNCNFYQNGGDGFDCGGDMLVTNCNIYENAEAGLHLTGYTAQIENVIIHDNGTYGIWAIDCDPDFINVDVYNHPNHGFYMNANVWPEYFDLVLTGNLTNDFRVDGGTINHNITWEVGEYPFIVIGAFSIRGISSIPNPRLTLEKGLTLKFAPGSGITIGHSYYAYRGELWAEGTANPDSIITFTALNGLPGGWEGITFTNGSGSSGSVSSLKYCLIEKGNDYNLYSETTSQPTIDNCTFTKSQNKGINLYNSSISITNSEIYGNSGDGLYGVLHPYYSNDITVNNCNFYQNGGDGFDCGGDMLVTNCNIYENSEAGLHLTGYEAQFENIIIRDNGTYGIWVTDCDPDFVNVDVFNHPNHGFYMNANVWPEYFDLVLTGNLTNDFRVDGGNVQHNITWEVGEYPFIVIGAFSICGISGIPNPRLTLEKGLTLQFAPGAGITVGHSYYGYRGELWAEGASDPDSVITFTSLNGETGGWRGIEFVNGSGSSGSISSLKHCIIEKGNEYNLYLDYTNQPTIDSCIIRESKKYGIRTYSANPFIKNSQIVNNLEYGFYLGNYYFSSGPTIGDTLGMGNDIFNNGQYDIYNNSDLDINAHYNFFGTTDPDTIASRIYDNADDAAKGIVNVDPTGVASNHLMGNYVSSKVLYNNSVSTVLDDVSAVIVDNLSDTLETCLSNIDGFATFLSLQNGTYTLDASSTKSWAGVNATDALLVMQHFASIITLDGIRLKAADVNASSTVNSTDALAILQRFAHITDSFNAGDWAFLAANNPAVIAGNDINTILWGLCYGDVNGSYVPAAKKSSVQNVSFICDGEIEVDGFTANLPLKLVNQKSIGAISLRISYPSDRVNIENVLINNSSKNVIYTAENGILSIAWCDIMAIEPGGKNALLNIQFRINDDAVFKDGLQLTPLENSELADAKATIIENAVLSYPNLVRNATKVDVNTAYQFGAEATPNIFKDYSILEYSLPESGKVNCKLYNVQGKIVAELLSETRASGNHSLNLNGSKLKSGMYFIKLELTGKKQTYKTSVRIQIL